METTGITTVEWVGLGLFVVGLAIAALSLGLTRVLGWGYAAFLLLEGGAIATVGLGVAFGQLPLEGQRPFVVSGTLAAVGIWHITMMGFWPLPRHHGPSRR